MGDASYVTHAVMMMLHALAATSLPVRIARNEVRRGLARLEAQSLALQTLTFRHANPPHLPGVSWVAGPLLLCAAPVCLVPPWTPYCVVRLLLY